MARMMIRLDEDEREAVLKLARTEKRDPRQQAALLLRDALIRRGFLVCKADDAPHPAERQTQNGEMKR